MIAPADFTHNTHSDVLIVGAGSSGSLLAARLSEDEALDVVLLESGSERSLDLSEQAVLENANQPGVVSDRNWKVPVNIRGDAPSASGKLGSVFVYEGGRVLGGSSSVNAALAMRGLPSDYDGWAKTAGDQWRWNNVLPLFKAIENDDVEDPKQLHGRRGPMPVRRDSSEELRPLQAGHFEVCTKMGYQSTSDHNNPYTTGVGLVPRNALKGKRVSTNQAYLQPALERKNLRLITGAHADVLLWTESGQVSGVQYMRAGELHTATANRIILCLGALQTPALLMRSGVGDSSVLKRAGVATRLEMLGVGNGIKDHPVVGIWGLPKPDYCNAGEVLRQVLLRYSSGFCGDIDDMSLCFMAGQSGGSINPRLAASGIDPTMAGLTCTSNASHSKGRVYITSRDSKVLPEVWLNCAGDDRDLEPLIQGVELAWQMMSDPILKQGFNQVFAWSDEIIRSKQAVKNAIRSFVRPAAHLCCSARMGQASDPMSVTNGHCRVHGLDNLWIGDASVFPEIPTAPPHLSVLMVAEQLARHLGAPNS